MAGIACCGLEGPGIEPRRGEFPDSYRQGPRPSRLLHNGYCISFQGRKRTGRDVDNPPLLYTLLFCSRNSASEVKGRGWGGGKMSPPVTECCSSCTQAQKLCTVSKHLPACMISSEFLLLRSDNQYTRDAT